MTTGLANGSGGWPSYSSDSDGGGSPARPSPSARSAGPSLTGSQRLALEDLVEGKPHFVEPSPECLVHRVAYRYLFQDVPERGLSLAEALPDQRAERPTLDPQDLRVFGEGVEGLLENGAHVLQPHLEEDLRLNALYLEFDAIERCVHPDREPYQIGKLR
jgi:hypothetical protein